MMRTYHGDGQSDPTETLREAAALLRVRASGATPGPWAARFTNRFGFPFDSEPGDPYEEDPTGTFTLVAGTALPRGDNRDPGHYEVHHMLAAHDDDLPVEQSRELLASLRWAATVHPGLAEPLAAWLEREARVVGKRHPSDSNPALAVACAILGSDDS